MKYPLKVLLILTPVVLILDQWTKHLVVRSMELGERIPVIAGYFDIVHVRNTGAAFGMLADSHPAFRIPFFYGISFIALGVLAYFFWKIRDNERFFSFPLSLVTAGVLGNLIDRFRYGNVVDFVSWHIQHRFEWPAFNVADSAITISMALILLSAFRSDRSLGQK